MQKNYPVIVIFVISTFFFGCSKNATYSTKDTAKKPVGFANVTVLFDGDGTLVADSLAGTLITAANTSGSFTTLTNAKGDFTLPVLPGNGMVTITYSRKGYGEMKDYYSETAYDSIQNGLSSPGGPSLYRISPVIVNSLTGTLNGNELSLVCNVTAPRQGYAVRFAIGKSRDIAYNNCKTFNNVTRAVAVKNGDNTISFCTPCEQQCGYKPGDTLYMKAYGDLVPSINYYDMVNERVVLPCVNTNTQSQVVSFVVGK